MIIFLDTETTGVGPTDRLCQVAYKISGTDKIEVGTFKPPVPISLEAMSVNHITNEMVEDCYPFAGGVFRNTLKELLERPDAVMVAHNAPFDAGMLAREGIVPTKTICTLAIAREISKRDSSMKKHDLSYLRYFYKLNVSLNIRPHSADADVYVLEKLFELFHTIGAVRSL